MPEGIREGFYARFLGGFFLEYKGSRIIIAKNMKQKGMQLLAILLKAGEEGVSRKGLTEMLEWGGESWERKLNNLRRQTYELRAFIAEEGFPEGKYIQVSGGRYYFSREYQVRTDTGEVDRLYQEARKQADPAAREGILWEICRLYQGEFLPSLVAEEWALVENAHYRSVYSRCVNELCRILKSRGEYTRLLKLCGTASQIHPYDEWQAVQIDCLVASRRYQDARQIRSQANQLFTKELGIAPFGGREESHGESAGADDGVMAEVMAGLWEDSGQKGAYRCDYSRFIDVYRFMVRMVERSQIRLSLLLCTLESAGGRPEWAEGLRQQDLPGAGGDLEMGKRPEMGESSEVVKAGEGSKEPTGSQVSERQMEQFSELLAGLIRENDVYTRFSSSQYLVLLASFGENQEAEVARRLRRGLEAFEKEEGLRVNLETQAVEGPNRKEAM